jgi:hypothetical protein
MNWMRLAGLMVIVSSACVISARAANTNAIPAAASAKILIKAPPEGQGILPRNSTRRTLIIPPPQARPVLQAKPSNAPPRLKPGVYQTYPFSCIVIVPPPHLDDGAVVGSGPLSTNLFHLPTIRPELKFIPLSPAK